MQYANLIITFQSTRPRGRTRPAEAPEMPSKGVSIHASSREDATSYDPERKVFIMFQSTRPRGRTRLRKLCLCGALHYVSIHASSREDATIFQGTFNMRLTFQSTRPRGRTRHKRLLAVNHGQRFNPRVLAGGRDNATDDEVFGFQVSIHASSREDATRLIHRCWRRLKFQSTRPRGRTRLIKFAYCIVDRVSIHASSREDATALAHLGEQAVLFQSTRPRGRTRHEIDHSKLEKIVSIHASSREDATTMRPMYRMSSGFNPRVLAGGRDILNLEEVKNEEFQSTRPRGRTRHPQSLDVWHLSQFQSTRPRGRTRR